MSINSTGLVRLKREVFVLLAQKTLWDLCKGFCVQSHPLSLGS